jgi:transcriptional regulator with XRE-family HTH domain
MQRFGEKVRTLRERRGLTTRQLADLIGVKSHAHITALEGGRSKPSVDVLLQLMRVFGVSCDVFLDDSRELDAADGQTTNIDETA